MPADPRRLCFQARESGLALGWDTAPDLGLVLVAGPDSVDFLHARLTSDVRALTPGQGQLSAKLTGRGELIGYFSLHRLPDLGQPFPSFFLLAPRTELGLLLRDLTQTLISEDVLLEDVSSQFEAVLLQGPQASGLVDRWLDGTSPVDHPEFSLQTPRLSGGNHPADLMVLSRSFTGDPGRLLLWNARPGMKNYAAAVIAAADEEGWAIPGDKEIATAVWRWLTVEAGWPVVGRDLETGRAVLPKTGLEQQVVSATKGCYPGQEVVARIRTYGSVPTALRGLVLDGGNPAGLENLPVPGSDLHVDGKIIGTWGTSAWSVTRERCISLAFIDRDHRTPGTTLQVETHSGIVRAEVVLLPFFRAADRQEKARHLHDRAIQLFSGGDDEAAVSLLEDALRHDPGLHDAYEALGVILGRGEKYVQAIEIFRRLEEIAPAEPMVHTNLSLFYMKIGDKTEAENQQAQATLKRFANVGNPEEAKALETAAAEARKDDARRRIGMFEAVLEIDRADPLALMGMGQALADLGDYDRADGYLAEALGSQADNSVLYAARGKVLEALGRGKDAGDIYRQGVAVASRKGDLMPLKDMEHRLLMLNI